MKTRIILASASPRRIEILRSHGIEAEVMPAEVDETLPEGTVARIGCMHNALKKALFVEQQLQRKNAGTEKCNAIETDAADADEGAQTLIIAADTVVFNGHILGKPEDEQDAFHVLQSLRHTTHQVMTGTAVVCPGREDRCVFCECTEVSFGDYSDREILDYIATGEPMDKAGSYAIQGFWSKHVTEINGDYENVIGLPWEHLRTVLKELGADV